MPNRVFVNPSLKTFAEPFVELCQAKGNRRKNKATALDLFDFLQCTKREVLVAECG